MINLISAHQHSDARDARRAAEMADAMDEIFLARGEVTEAALEARGFTATERARLSGRAIATLRRRGRAIDQAA